VPPLICTFRHADDWGLFLKAYQAPYVDDAGKGINLEITLVEGRPMIAFSGDGEIDARLKESIARSVTVTQSEEGEDTLTLALPTGKYSVAAFGSGPNVKDGGFVFALPLPGSAFFSAGASPDGAVCSLGRAPRTITVGSIDSRNEAAVHGSIASFRGPGFLTDKHVKPDLAASGGMGIALGGKYIVLQGTDAAAAVVTGVIARMLEKDPLLTADQIQKILTGTATTDKFTGKVPNGTWGYGKLNADRAMAATPARRRRG
jgi:hypothetical protein